MVASPISVNLCDFSLLIVFDERSNPFVENLLVFGRILLKMTFSCNNRLFDRSDRSWKIAVSMFDCGQIPKAIGLRVRIWRIAGSTHIFPSRSSRLRRAHDGKSDIG